MKSIKKTLISLALNKPKTLVFMSLALFSIFLPFTTNLKMDFSAKVWFQESDEHIKVLERFEKTFGNDESLVILASFEDGVFKPENIALLQKLTKRMWSLPEVVRVESLTNYQWTRANGDDIVTDSFIPDDNLEESFIRERKEKAQDIKYINGFYVSPDNKGAALYARLIHRPGKSPNYSAVTKEAEKIVKEFKREGVHFYITGPAPVNHRFQVSSFRDMRILVPFLFLFIFLYLLFSFRTKAGVILPFIVIFMSIFSVMGLIGILGITINSLTFILPSILIAISIADSVHLLATYYNKVCDHGEHQRACQESLDKNLYPIFLTSISTAIGFLTLLSSDIRPIYDLGILASAGTLLAFIYSYLIVIPIMGMTKKSRHQKLFYKQIPKHLTKRYINFLYKFRFPIIVTFVGISALAVYLGLQNIINTNPYKYFKEGTPVRVANDYSLKTFNGVGGPELLIDSGKPEGVTEPEFLKKVEKLNLWLKSKDYINKTVSLVDIFKEVNQSLMGGDPDHYKINDNRQALAQELFLYNMAVPQGMQPTDRVDVSRRYLRVSVLWSLQDSMTSLAKVREIESYSKKIGLDLLVTGKPVLFQRMNDYVVQTFFQSIGIAIFVITILLTVVFRSVRLGALSLIPNFFPILLAAGLLTVLGTPIDLGCAIVASVTLGIAVDDTIHFFGHYNQLRKSGLQKHAALEEVISSTGLALIVTTVILVSAFGLFYFASLTPNINFGVLSAFVLSTALFCDLFLLPTLILLRKTDN